jgi:2-dehydro-3-deoxyphosphogluconate aldolase / (4S)-4-hydroxy-2-oxoglutarate aldolase
MKYPQSSPLQLSILPAFKTRILPVIVISNVDQAIPMAEALLAGGIDAMEITLRHAAGLAAMAAVAKAVPQMWVGAGTLTHPSEVAQVKDAGATFALSPGYSPAVLQAARDLDLPFVPGVMTPSEVMAAREAGYRLLKLFPAAQAGGIGMLQALRGPLGDVQFCPTGGVSIANVREFLQQPNVAMVGGSWLTPPALVEAGRWGEITALARAATDIADEVAAGQGVVT